MEDALHEIADAGRANAGALAKVRELDHDIACLAVPFDEWETVHRERLQVERDLLANRPVPAMPPSRSSAGGAAPGEWLIGAAGLVLLGLDVALLLHSRLTGSDPES